MPIDPAWTVAELVLEQPSRARVFEQFEIDYCCGGKRSLTAACEGLRLDLAAVVAALEAAGADPGDAEAVDWRAVPLAELCDHIVDVHHGRLREELPRLSTLIGKCERAHGADRPELATMQATFETLRLELEHHMIDEEERLFPACRAGGAFEHALLGHLEDEHLAAEALLLELRELTGAYDLESALCNTHRATLDGLRELELDLHRHIHEENNILFPRALTEAA